MKQIPTMIILAAAIGLLLSGCKQPVSGDAINSLSDSSSSSYGGSGCRGRSSGVKTGPNSIYLPYPSGTSYNVSQTWFGTFSHDSTGREHALDFPMSDNDDIYPVADGRVIAVKEDSNINCSSNCSDANYVLVDHGGGFYGRYLHFCYNCVDVAVGDLVNAGSRIGGAGNTGWSTETHLHFDLVDWEENCTVTYGFVENSNSLTALTVGASYTSQNTATGSYTPSVITGDVYSNVGITLTGSIPWYVAVGDSVNITGSLTSEAQSEGSNGVTVFLVNLNHELETSPSDNIESATTTFNFSYTIPSVTPGTYYLAISKSKNESYYWNNPPYMVVH